MSCLACGRNFHEECEYDDCEKCHPVKEEKPNVLVEAVRGRPLKDPEQMKDRKSTGRKRAALLYPIDLQAPCEWKGLKNCGGGTLPIIGCLDGRQVDRHHGPIKDPARNEVGNVHRICKPCHNHWHELNDLTYNEGEFSETKHDPVAATEEEIDTNALAWQTGAMKHLHTLASTKYRLKVMDD